MARTTWTVENWNGSGYDADGTIYTPNESQSDDLTSTQTKLGLANGSQTFMLPATKYNKEALRFVWLEIPESDIAFKNKISNYVINANYLRITDPLSNTYIGRFVYIRRIWILGVDNTWDIEAGFERME